MLRGIRAFRKEIDRVQAQLEKEAGHQADRPRTIESMQRTVANQTREQLVRLFTRR
jgi:Sec-independent protein translocase protein TatA